MRACLPSREGTVERDGVAIFYEVYGDGEPTVLLLPTWSIMHSRCWKMQIPYLARHYRVVTFDPRGNGRSNRPAGAEAYGEGAVFIGSAVPLGPAVPREEWVGDFTRPRDSYEGWDKFNRHYWLSDYEDFLEFFFAELHNEAHSTKQREDAVGWGLGTDPETLAATQLGPRVEADELRTLAARVRCPVLVIHGTDDAIRPSESGAAFADLLGGALVLLHGAGHAPHARDPVRVNLLIKQFADRVGR
jgi:pimeloyl-ACP methyl ester carboxylesterase